MFSYERLKNTEAYWYAVDVVEDNITVNGKNFTQAKYIKKQCQKFLDDLESSKTDDFPYYFDEEAMIQIMQLCRYINMGDGFLVGRSAYDSLAPFQWFLILNVFCWKHKDKDKRRYELAVLLISRKNAKTFLTALIIILLMLLEPKFSEFYSVAPSKDLSKKVKQEMRKIIKSSPFLDKKFKDVFSETRCLLTESVFVPLACSNDKLDARKPNAFIGDEVGVLRDGYPIEAMKSGQLSVQNRLGILISTAYDEVNPMEDYVEYSQKVLDGIIQDETHFSMIYRPDEPNNWLSDEAIWQTNPLAIYLNECGIEDNLDYIYKMREQAINMPSTEKNYKTKLLNIKVSSLNLEPFIALDDLRKCKIDTYDWTDKEVHIGVDLSLSGDNTAVSILTFDYTLNKYVAQSWVFFPSDKVDEKSKKEKVDYMGYTNKGFCFPCGTRIIDYGYIEDFITDYLVNDLKVKVLSISYDKYNAISSVSKFEEIGFECVEIPQNYQTLHSATKLMQEKVITEEFLYVENDLFELNVTNAQLIYSSNGNLTMISKKNSNYKIDAVASLINAFVTIQVIKPTKVSVYETQGIEYYDDFWNDF